MSLLQDHQQKLSEEEDTGMALNIIAIQTKPDGFKYQHYGLRN